MASASLRKKKKTGAVLFHCFVLVGGVSRADIEARNNLRIVLQVGRQVRTLCNQGTELQRAVSMSRGISAAVRQKKQVRASH